MQYIPQKKHFKKLVTLYFWCEQKPIFVCSANKTKPIAVNMSKKKWNLWENLTNVSERELYDLQYIGNYVILQLYKKN